MKRHWLVPLLLILGACGEAWTPGQHPVAAMRHGGSTLHVETAPGAQLDDLILIDLFSGFSPAEPVETIAASHGSPREIAQPNSGERYYVYEVPAGALWTGYQQTADGATHRLIQLHPDALPLAAVVKPSVLAQLPPVSGSYWIIVYAPGGQLPTARIEVTSDRVNRVLWFGESTTGPTPGSFSRFPG